MTTWLVIMACNINECRRDIIELPMTIVQCVAASQQILALWAGQHEGMRIVRYECTTPET